MKEHPIIFSSDMVKAILEGRKSMTRRIIKPQPEGNVVRMCLGTENLWSGFEMEIRPDEGWIPRGESFKCPYGQVGDRLWVKEKFSKGHKGKTYYATWDNPDDIPVKWTSSRFMPRWASRITLEITDIRVERLQEITEEDAKSEGVIPYESSHQTITGKPLKSTFHYKRNFVKLWDTINGKKYPWKDNPWVWVISFKRITSA